MRARYLTKATLLCALGALPAAGPAAEIGVEARPVAAFDKIVLRAVGELTLEQGDKEAVSVEAERRLLPKISTAVKDGVLYLDIKERQFSSPHPVRYRVTVRTLAALEAAGSGSVSMGKMNVAELKLAAAGSGNVTVESVTGKSLTCKLSGASTITVKSGSIASESVEIDGAGSYAAPKLVADRAQVSINGAGEVEIAARATLSAHIAGAGSVAYFGDPKVTKSILGAGSVQRSGPI